VKPIINLENAKRIVHRWTDQRAHALNTLEQWVIGTQYDGRPDFFAADQRVDLFDRAPCIVYPIAKSAIDSNVDLLFGELRFPTITTRGMLVDDAEDGSERARQIDDAIRDVCHQARLAAVAREAFASAQGCRSVAAIFGVRGGRPFVDLAKAAWCTPTLDADGACRRLVISYAFVDLVRGPDGTERAVPKAFRREIDDTLDVTYRVVELQDGVVPAWVVETQIAHGLGFCPVVWYPHMRGASIVGQVDGVAVHEHLLDEIKALDFALSMRHRAALYAGDPQWTEAGVAPGYNPSGGRTPRVVAQASPMGGAVSATNPARGAYVDGSSEQRKARRKGPGVVWQYEDKDVHVQLHTLPGDALKALDEHAQDLLHKICDSLGVVILTPESVKFASTVTGKALDAMKARQYARCDQYRADVADRLLLPAVGMLLRIALTKRLPIRGLAALEEFLAQPDAQLSWSWHSPPLDVVWGPYTQIDAEERGKIISAATQALAGGLASRRVAVQMAKPALGIDNVDALMRELEAEEEMGAAASDAAAPAGNGRAPMPAKNGAPTRAQRGVSP
jgi:hypothetical protein